MTPARATTALLLALALAVVAGCSGDPAEQATDPATAVRSVVPGFQVRPVTGDAELGDCLRDLPLDESGVVCAADDFSVAVGPAAVVGGVVAAEAVDTGAAWGVQVQLDEEASAALQGLTEASASSNSRIALLVDGQLVSAPTVAGVIGGGTLQILGDWTQEEAARIAEQAQSGT